MSENGSNALRFAANLTRGSQERSADSKKNNVK